MVESLLQSPAQCGTRDAEGQTAGVGAQWGGRCEDLPLAHTEQATMKFLVSLVIDGHQNCRTDEGCEPGQGGMLAGKNGSTGVPQNVRPQEQAGCLVGLYRDPLLLLPGNRSNHSGSEEGLVWGPGRLSQMQTGVAMHQVLRSLNLAERCG